MWLHIRITSTCPEHLQQDFWIGFRHQYLKKTFQLIPVYSQGQNYFSLRGLAISSMSLPNWLGGKREHTALRSQVAGKMAFEARHLSGSPQSVRVEYRKSPSSAGPRRGGARKQENMESLSPHQWGLQPDQLAGTKNGSQNKDPRARKEPVPSQPNEQHDLFKPALHKTEQQELKPAGRSEALFPHPKRSLKLSHIISGGEAEKGKGNLKDQSSTWKLI